MYQIFLFKVVHGLAGRAGWPMRMPDGRMEYIAQRNAAWRTPIFIVFKKVRRRHCQREQRFPVHPHKQRHGEKNKAMLEGFL